MKTVQGQQEYGVEVGNHYDKYGSRNPIARLLMAGFMHALDDLVKLSQQRQLHEIGCGEGVLSLRWLSQGFDVRACDFSQIAIDLARENALACGQSPAAFSQKNIYTLSADDKAPLIVCCEVLEHLEDPQHALRILVNLADPWLIVSVPREPLWSLLNMARGKYWRDWGNTPGHIQRWRQRDFIQMVSSHMEIVAVRSPLPWTMLLCQKRQQV